MKKLIWSAFVILALALGGLLALDILQLKRATALLDQIQISITKIEKGDEIEIGIQMAGEIPEYPVTLTIFTDNRYLELVPKSWSDEEVVTYIGQTAGGAETKFAISQQFDGEMSVRYVKKEKGTAPLIYAYFESEVKRFILEDAIIRTGNFE
ncbi:hypothetical protein BAG01nite_31610 [Brevibacillus agri]|uniref:Uncharacterized protein n=1 Tax=Brevibacillus agri TaxID=51101 RepID=A0A3M8APD3_9BACL|nr:MULTISPECIES: hypothetical protein [Brevibacillus]ELK39000.1 hypothetical protein D478_26704 [Brevibacillus agri BAB-2500]EJL40267.1 hypothetical protein PMI08_04538 [Brevibacillus sp. CF112]MBG9564718.1 hypothetical protein [Brevibacillus agri]MDN4095285.1 hypothetical protein [Brevibacillus agri]QAV15087.1 hypothetical protein BA6348_21360 [Brevibacillus agri]